MTRSFVVVPSTRAAPRCDGGDLYLVCIRPEVGVRISRHEVNFDLVTSGTEDFIEATVVFVSAEYRKSIVDLFELRRSMPCFSNS